MQGGACGLNQLDRWGQVGTAMAQAEWLSQRVEARWSPEDPALMAHTPRVH